MSITRNLGPEGALLVTLGCFLAALGLWYASIRFDAPRLKTVGVMIAIFPVLGFGLQIAAYYFDWGAPSDNFKTTVVGTAHREQSAVREFPMYFNNPGIPHTIEFTPKPSIGEQAVGEVILE